MALIGNNSVVNKSFARFYCGIGGNTRANSTNLSYNKSRQLFFPFKSSLGEGYNFGDTDIGPISPGGLASINIVQGIATVAATALRVKASTGEVTGSAIVEGSLSVLTQGSGSVTGSATVAGSLAAVSSLSGATTGSAGVSGSLKSNVPLAGAITGSASLAASLTGIGSLSGSIDVSESVGMTPDSVADAVWNSIAASYNTVGTMGEKVNDAGSASNPWTEVIESGYTAAEILKVLAAFAAGKTSITALGGGDATVVFRDLGDTKDRIEVDMEGSERTAVTLDTV